MSTPDRVALKALPAKYPLIYRALGRTGRYPLHPFAHRGFECGDGWYAIIDELSAWLETEARLLKIAGRPAPLVVQVKEKFGGLCFSVRQFPRNRFFGDLRPRVTEAEMKQSASVKSAGKPQLCGARAIVRRCVIDTLRNVNATTEKVRRGLDDDA